MNAQRYIVVKGILTKGNELIPIWDERISLNKDEDVSEEEDYGYRIKVKGDYNNYFSLTDCILDVETKKLSAGIELDVFPYKKEDAINTFNKGEEIYYKKDKSKYNCLSEATIVDIVYEKFDLEIKKGSYISKYYLEYSLKDVNINPDGLYALKIYRPTYILNDGSKVEYEHDMFKKLK